MKVGQRVHVLVLDAETGATVLAPAKVLNADVGIARRVRVAFDGWPGGALFRERDVLREHVVEVAAGNLAALRAAV